MPKTEKGADAGPVTGAVGQADPRVPFHFNSPSCSDPLTGGWPRPSDVGLLPKKGPAEKDPTDLRG